MCLLTRKQFKCSSFNASCVFQQGSSLKVAVIMCLLTRKQFKSCGVNASCLSTSRQFISCACGVNASCVC